MWEACSRRALYLTRACPALRIAQCVTYRVHVPERITGQVSKYYLFKAAEAGCLRCVQQYLEREFIEPLSVSDDERSSTILDFAEDATEKNTPGAAAVVKYLRSSWPRVPCRKRASLTLLERPVEGVKRQRVSVFGDRKSNENCQV